MKIFILNSLIAILVFAFSHTDSYGYRRCSKKSESDDNKKKSNVSKMNDDDNKKKKNKDDDDKKKSASSSNMQKPPSSGQSVSNTQNSNQKQNKNGGKLAPKEIVEARLPSSPKPSKNQLGGTTFLPFNRGRIDSTIFFHDEKQEEIASKLQYSAEEILQATRENDINLIRPIEEEQPPIAFLTNEGQVGQVTTGQESQSKLEDRASIFEQDNRNPASGKSSDNSEANIDPAKKLPTDPWMYHVAQNSRESVIEQLKANPSMRESLRSRLINMNTNEKSLSVQEREYVNFMTASLDEAEKRAEQKQEAILAASEEEFFASIQNAEGLTTTRMIAELESQQQHEAWMNRTEPLFLRVKSTHKKILKEGRL